MTVTTDGRGGSEENRFRSWGALDLLILLVPCLAPVLGLLARNPVGVPHAERLFAAAFLLWLVVCGLAAVAVRLGADRVATILTGVVFAFAITRGEGFINYFGYAVGLPLVLVLLALIAILTHRLRHTPIAPVLVWAIVVALVSGPIIEAFNVLPAYGSSARIESEAQAVMLSHDRPDLWLVVLDGHPGLRAMDQDFEEVAASELSQRLRHAGFDVPESAWSAYWTTDYSVSSLLEMAHPVEATYRNDATTQDLYDIIGGDNRLMTVLDANGYTTHMVESGWSGSSCGPRFDGCIASHWLDESMFLLLSPSLLKRFILETFGYAFTAGSINTMEWALDNATRLSEDGHPSFVFAHLMAPHPPFLLDSDCDLAYEDDRSSVAFQQAGVTNEARQRYLEEQMACVERFVLELAGRIDDHSVLVVVSDHGTDRRRQLERGADTWTGVDVIERMNALVAVKGLPDCALDEPLIVQNVMSHVLTCLSNDEVEMVEPVFHLGPGVALRAGDFGQLVGVDELEAASSR